jgi:hypothetical protein
MSNWHVVSLTLCLFAGSTARLVADAAPFTGFADLAFTNGHATLAWPTATRANRVTILPHNGAAISELDYCLTRDGKVCAAWTEATPDDSDIYAQLFNPDGTPRWGEDAVSVIQFRGHQRGPRVAPALDGGVFVVWESDSAGTNNVNLWCQRILPNGRLVWEIPVPICTHPGRQGAVALAPDPEGGIIVTWEDYRNGNADIYGQRIEYDGSPLDQEDGVEIEVAPGDQTDVRFVYNDLGRPVSLQWYDHRPGFDTPVRVETDLAALPIPEPVVSPLFLLPALLLLLRRRSPVR